MPTETPEQALAALCSETTLATSKAVGWLERNKDAIGAKFPSLRRDFRRREMLARRYEKASRRPVSVGVYGASQAGKSYLVSALARKGSGKLTVKLDREYDFLEEINPEAKEEATGLVTRFTIKDVPTPAGYPVCAHLLNQTDLVKILANSYFLDFNATAENVPTEVELEAAIKHAEAQATKSAVDNLTDVEIDDLRRYFRQHFANRPTVRLLEDRGYWTRLETLAPRLRIDDRLRLYSFLWGRIDQFSNFYRQLYLVLESLGFDEQAFCGIEALIEPPNYDRKFFSIIDVNTLKTLSDPDNVVAVQSASGRTWNVQRALLTAIVGELIMKIRDQPWPFFEHTDLLDFPGARSRLMVSDAASYMADPEALAQLFRRGKVGYLFDRYCDESDLSSMLLCLPPQNPEVSELKGLMSTWIRATHGADPVTRSKQMTSLFVVMTKFDLHFEGKGGRGENSPPWTTILSTPLTKFFVGMGDDWAAEWHPRKPFNNVIWLRNPNFKSSLMAYNGNDEEVGVARPDKIAEFKREYLTNDMVQQHIRDPEQCWEEAFRLKDGGITLLAESLAPVCRPELKREQIRARLGELRAEMAAALSEFHVDDDAEAERNKRIMAANRALVDLEPTILDKRFGHLLSAFRIGNEELQSLFRRLSVQGELSAGAGPNISSIFKRAGLDAARTENKVVRDKYMDLAVAAVTYWTERILQLVQQDKMLTFLKTRAEPIELIVRELLAGAERINLTALIADEMRRVAPALEKAPLTMLSEAMAASERINRYVWKLNQDMTSLDKRVRVDDGTRAAFKEQEPVNGIVQLPVQETAFYEPFIADWLATMMALVEHNAEGGQQAKFSAQEAAALQAIMTALSSDRGRTDA